MTRTHRSFLQEVRDLLAIALMLLIMKTLLFGNVSVKELLSRVTTSRAVAAESMSTTSNPTMQTSADVKVPMPSPETFALYKEHIEYLDRVLQQTQTVNTTHYTDH